MNNSHLFALLFFSGVVSLVLSGQREFYLIQQMKTWSDARNYCRSEYSDLAVIKSSAHMQKVLNEAQKYKFTSSAWIGMQNSIYNWLFWTVSYGYGVSSPLWNDTQPDIFVGCSACARTEGGKWFDEPCSASFPFVCLDNKNGNDSYIYYADYMTWGEAAGFCATHHTYLAPSNNALESGIIQQLVNSSLEKTAWIALRRFSCKWVNSDYVYMNWMPGQPNNFMQPVSCGYLNNSLAAVTQCSEMMPFFCHEDFKMQIVRLKVQSYENITDPAVNLVILEQISQKLKAQGMKNFTVTWRQLPNKVIFTKIN